MTKQENKNSEHEQQRKRWSCEQPMTFHGWVSQREKGAAWHIETISFVNTDNARHFFKYNFFDREALIKCKSPTYSTVLLFKLPLSNPYISTSSYTSKKPQKIPFPSAVSCSKSSKTQNDNMSKQTGNWRDWRESSTTVWVTSFPSWHLFFCLKTTSVVQLQSVTARLVCVQVMTRHCRHITAPFGTERYKTARRNTWWCKSLQVH